MSATTTILPSKVIQIGNDLALCEDGSIWAITEARTTPYTWVCIHPPHQPSTQPDDFKEALYWLDLLWHDTSQSHEVLGSVLAFLRKHGRVK